MAYRLHTTLSMFQMNITQSTKSSAYVAISTFYERVNEINSRGINILQI